MRGWHVVAVALACVPFGRPLHAQEEAGIALAWEPGRPVRTPARGAEAPGRTVKLAKDLPGDLALPKHLTAPQAARVPWGASATLAILFDPARKELWVDRDLDGDLAEEAAIPAPTGNTGGVSHAHVRVGPQAGATQVQVRFSWTGTTPPALRVLPWVHRQGVGLLGDRLRRIALVDEDGDLRFDGAGRDHAYVDLDGDGETETDAADEERIAVGAEFRLGEEGYRLEVPAPDGQSVRFARLATAPPRVPRRWKPLPVPPAGAPVAGSTEDFATLRAMATSGQDYERTWALEQLGILGTAEAGAFLADAARRTVNVERRAAAARALGNPAFLAAQGEEVVRLALKGPAPVAVAAIEALHAMGHPGREQALLQILARDPDERFEAATLHLAYVGSEAARERLLALWGEPTRYRDRSVLYEAIRVLPAGPPADVAAAAAEELWAAPLAHALLDLEALGDARARTRALAAGRLAVGDESVEARLTILIMHGDEQCIAALLDTVGTGDADYRQELSSRLSMLRGPGVAKALILGLQHAEPEARALAADVLGALRQPEVLAALLARVRSEDDPRALGALIGSLGEHADPKAVDALASLAKRLRPPLKLAVIRALARAKDTSAKARSLLLDTLDATAWEERVVALDAVAAGDDAKVAALVVPSLKHAKRQVRRAAASALTRLRVVGAIPPLIAQLALERDAGVRNALALALFRTTGMNLYDDAEVWRRWWAEHGAGFVVPEVVPARPPQAQAGTAESFFGIPVQGSRLVFVVDKSGSMEGEALALAVAETLKAVSLMPDGDSVDVVCFGSEVEPWSGALTELTTASRAKLAKHMRALRAEGATNLYDALAQALSYDDVEALYVLSDGAPNLGRYVEEPQILRAVRRLNQVARATIHAVAIGYDSDLLRTLAEENGGAYVRR